jgi:hypothetical protein
MSKAEEFRQYAEEAVRWVSILLADTIQGGL